MRIDEQISDENEDGCSGEDLQARRPRCEQGVNFEALHAGGQLRPVGTQKE